jgi:hypothetical protein
MSLFSREFWLFLRWSGLTYGPVDCESSPQPLNPEAMNAAFRAASDSPGLFTRLVRRTSSPSIAATDWKSVL